VAGYSGKPLSVKLGIKPGTRIALLGAPADYAGVLGPLPSGVVVSGALRGKLDLIQFFTREARELERRMPALARALAADGALWISWPKGASKVPTDLNEDRVRALALRHGLVDVKVCAVDEVWSGLKLVYRLRDRPRSRKGK
jgi:hypothetical protein